MQDRGAKNAEEEKLRKEKIRKPKTQPCKTKPAKIRHPAEKARSKSSRRVKDVPPARRGRCSGFRSSFGAFTCSTPALNRIECVPRPAPLNGKSLLRKTHS